MSTHPTPSEHARRLVRGGYDMHVHIDPDFVPRIIDDVGLARRCIELGLAGFQMKSHYNSTAERARTVNAAVPGVRAIGAIVLNRAVGGINPLAVEIAAREGARTVWMPTVNSVNEMEEVHSFAPGAPMPVWMKFEVSLREAGVEAEPVAVLDAEGRLLPAVERVFEVVARHQLVLATGHLARDEIFAVVDGALAAGIRDVVVTHPEFPSQNLSIADQVALASRGALLERCFTTPYTGKVSWEHVYDGVRATGAANNALSTDLGQVFNPPVEDGLALFADRFLGAGFSEEEVQAMAVTNTRRLAGEAR
ncbi:MAG: cytosolic protein [Acidobacteriota bacterium]|nr:cytosolic protein [Acidobacteriota bacterium]